VTPGAATRAFWFFGRQERCEIVGSALQTPEFAHNGGTGYGAGV